MIRNDQELRATLDRIQRLGQQVKKLRLLETNPNNYSSEGQALLDKSRTRILAFQVLAFIGVAIFVTFTFFAHW